MLGTEDVKTVDFPVADPSHVQRIYVAMHSYSIHQPHGLTTFVSILNLWNIPMCCKFPTDFAYAQWDPSYSEKVIIVVRACS